MMTCQSRSLRTYSSCHKDNFSFIRAGMSWVTHFINYNARWQLHLAWVILPGAGGTQSQRVLCGSCSQADLVNKPELIHLYNMAISVKLHVIFHVVEERKSRMLVVPAIVTIDVLAELLMGIWPCSCSFSHLEVRGFFFFPVMHSL